MIGTRVSMEGMIRALTIAMLATGLAVAQSSGPPVVTAWRVNPAAKNANRALRAMLPEVQAVTVEGPAVVVESAGLSLQSLAPLDAGDRAASVAARHFVWRLPLAQQRGPDLRAAVDVTGIFVNGVPMHNPASAMSWGDQNIWHLDAVRAAGAPSPLIASLLAGKGRHSPIIGFALDGFPVYGPWAWSAEGKVVRLRSSYRLRAVAERRSLPDGTQLTPGQEGPPVSAEYPGGTFAEDYEYVPGSGDLDEHNGRFVRTPEYPDGTYAYFLATGPDGAPAFPYLIGRTWYGDVPGAHPAEEKERIVVSGSEIRLNLRNRDGRPLLYPEKTHEKEIHLVVVSSDFRAFAHLHPELQPNGQWVARYAFPQAGRYRIFADYAVPGEGPRVESASVAVAGEGKATALGEPLADQLGVHMHVDGALETGRDIGLRFELPVTDLEPYLGAWMHVIVVSADGQDYIHVHPMDVPALAVNPWQHTHAALGPSPAAINATVGFRRPGVYHLWAQFQRFGEVITVPFDLTVKAGAPAVSVTRHVAGAIRVLVDASGFHPARITAPRGQAVRLAFDRKDAQNCARSVVFPELGLRRELAPGTVAEMVVPASTEGRELHFACGMNMFRGSLVIR